MLSIKKTNPDAERRFAANPTLLVSALMWVCVSLSREMELLLRPPTTAISVLKFCNCSSFCQRAGGNVMSEGGGDSEGMCCQKGVRGW